MKIDTLLGGKMISTYEYREGFIGSDAYKTYAPLKILGLGCILPHQKIPGISKGKLLGYMFLPYFHFSDAHSLPLIILYQLDWNEK